MGFPLVVFSVGIQPALLKTTAVSYSGGFILDNIVHSIRNCLLKYMQYINTVGVKAPTTDIY